MGNGYAILLWDGWGAGLVRLNPRLLVDGVDCYGNPKNWFPCESENPSAQEIVRRHPTLSVDDAGQKWTVIRD